MSAASDADALGTPTSPARVTGIGRDLTVWGSLALLTVAAAWLGLVVGRGHAIDDATRALFLKMRGYRVAVAFLSGGGLAVGGTLVQGLFRNPLASPQILGTQAGALLGGKIAVIGTFLVMAGRGLSEVSPEMLVPLGCVLGALASLITVLSISSLRAGTVVLVLTGFVLNGLFLSFGSFLDSISQVSPELQRALSSFSAGSLSGSGPRQLALCGVMVVAGTLPTLIQGSSLDVMLSGEEEAASLGVDVARVRFWCVVWAAIVTAGAVAVGGGVGFIGLLVPHALRYVLGTHHRKLIPAAFVAGGAFLILCDALCRALPLRQEVPLGVLTEVLGAPAFLWILRRVTSEERHV